MFDDVVAEPVPERFQEFLERLNSQLFQLVSRAGTLVPSRRLHNYALSLEQSREHSVMSIWNTIQQEMREVFWLASVVGALSILGASFAVVVAGLA